MVHRGKHNQLIGELDVGQRLAVESANFDSVFKTNNFIWSVFGQCLVGFTRETLPNPYFEHSVTHCGCHIQSECRICSSLLFSHFRMGDSLCGTWNIASTLDRPAASTRHMTCDTSARLIKKKKKHSHEVATKLCCDTIVFILATLVTTRDFCIIGRGHSHENIAQGIYSSEARKKHMRESLPINNHLTIVRPSRRCHCYLLSAPHAQHFHGNSRGACYGGCDIWAHLVCCYTLYYIQFVLYLHPMWRFCALDHVSTTRRKQDIICVQHIIHFGALSISRIAQCLSRHCYTHCNPINSVLSTLFTT